jgi:hypothetical protein
MIMRKHKGGNLSRAWSPYKPGYVPKERPIPSHIDVQGGEALPPIKPWEVEKLATAAMYDSDDWGDIE